MKKIWKLRNFNIKATAWLAVGALTASLSVAGEMDAQWVPMYEKGAKTYYISGEIEGAGESEFMVDTGSGYMTINETTLASLLKNSKASYVKDLVGILADGSKKRVPVYRIASLQLGEQCELQNVEAAIFPDDTRQILGLSALKKAGALISFEPPTLILSNCDTV